MNLVLDDTVKLCITLQAFHFRHSFMYAPLNIKETGAIEIFYCQVLFILTEWFWSL